MEGLPACRQKRVFCNQRLLLLWSQTALHAARIERVRLAARDARDRRVERRGRARRAAEDADEVAAALREATGGTTAITVYLMAATVTGFVVTLLMRERRGIPLGYEYGQAQASGHFVWQKPAATL